MANNNQQVIKRLKEARDRFLAEIERLRKEYKKEIDRILEEIKEEKLKKSAGKT